VLQAGEATVKGKLTIVHPDGRFEDEQLISAPSLARLQAIVGGFIEKVPDFEVINGVRCEVLCNEEGKLRGLPRNPVATSLWAEAAGIAPGRMPDELVGAVVILTGDDEFLGSL
jgi:hypothetical protein